MARPLAVIVGAGVAGLAAAWWLDKAGWRSVVVERSQNLRENGYMLGLSGLGFETARRMQLHERLETFSYRIDENVYMDSKGRELLRLRYRDFIRDLPYLAVRRTDLVRALAESLPESCSIRFGECISGFEDKGDCVEVALGSGETLRADLMIGADGFRSSTRERLFGSGESCLRPLGYYFSVYDVDAPKAFESDFVSYAEPGHLAEYYALHDGRLAAGLAGQARIGGDDIVGLPALHFDRGDRKRAGGRPGQRKLRHQLGRCRRPLRLVFGIDIVAKGLAGMIKDHRHMGGRVITLEVFGELVEHVAEPLHTAHGEPVRLAAKLGQGMEGAENIGRAVDEQQMHIKRFRRRERGDFRPVCRPPKGLRGGNRGTT